MKTIHPVSVSILEKFFCRIMSDVFDSSAKVAVSDRGCEKRTLHLSYNCLTIALLWVMVQIISILRLFDELVFLAPFVDDIQV